MCERLQLKRILLVGVMLGIAAAGVSAITGDEVMDLVRGRDTGSTSHALVEMRLVEQGGRTSVRVVEQYGKELAPGVSGAVIIFHSPASVEGTRFLTISHEEGGNDQWIYLPALKRVRRIAASEEDAEFMGTDFTYSDLGGEVIDAAHTFLREETLGGERTWVVLSIPTADSGSGYSRLIQWVSQEKLLPIKVEFYDRDGELLKINTMTRVEQVQGRWTVISNEMRNVQTGHSTTLEMQRFVYDEQLPDSLFSTNFLRTGRP